MALEARCKCMLCRLEKNLLAELSLADPNLALQILGSNASLANHSSLLNLVSYLRSLPTNASSDDLLRSVFRLRDDYASLVEPILVLAFLPLLHKTIRSITMQQPTLSSEDASQEALTFLLAYLHSDAVGNRHSHLAFAVSREIKRHVFTWAKQQSLHTAVLDQLDGTLSENHEHPDSMERLVLLRHFLHHSVLKGRLTATELNLLVDFKLSGGETNGTASNALRQKIKRLLAKLRDFAN